MAIRQEIQKAMREHFGPKPFFTLVANLDRRSWFEERSRVFEVRLGNVDHHPNTRGFTVDWIEQPRSDHVVIKFLTEGEFGLSQEGQVLQTTNSLFHLDSIHRPVRLHAWNSEPKLPTTYPAWVLLELAPPSEFPTLETYLQDEIRLPPPEALNITTAFIQCLHALHASGISHGDVEGPGAEQNLLWNPDNQILRLVDFGNSQTKPHRGRLHGLVGDQTGVGQVLTKTLTSHDFHPDTLEQALKKVLPSPLAARAQSIIENAIGVNSQDEIREYPRNALGTHQLLQDILELGRSLR